MKTSNVRGFTVTELLIVLTIMGTLLSIAIINISEYQGRTKLRTAAEDVAADIRHARWIAKTSSQICAITFDVISSTYTINGTQNASLPKGLRFGTDPSVMGRPTDPYSAPPADGVSFDSGGSRNIARFHPITGAVTPTGAVYLTDGKGTMAIVVSLYGRPKIWRSNGGRRWTPI